MTRIAIAAFILQILLSSIVSAQSYQETWASTQALAKIYREDRDQACRDAYNVGPAYAFYKGDFYKEWKGTFGPEDGKCVSRAPQEVVGNITPVDAEWRAYRACLVFDQNGNFKEIKGECPRFNPPPCVSCCATSGGGSGGGAGGANGGLLGGGGGFGGGGGSTGETLKVGNPVELPTLTKLHTEVDWVSPVDPRFAIKRHYRSDQAIVYRFSNADTSYRQDPLSTHWSMAYSDELHTSIHKNPLDPSDTLNYMRYVDAEGHDVYFRRATGLAQLFPEYGYRTTITGTYTGGTSNPYTITTPDNVAYRFTWRGGAPSGQHYGANRHYLQDITWPDGYKISLTRSFSQEGAKITSIQDNKGIRAEFEYSTDTLATGNYNVVKEWQRVVKVRLYAVGGGAPVELATIDYSYQDVPNLAESGRKPVITSVEVSDPNDLSVLREVHYDYDLNQFPALLTGISDGERTAGNDLIWKLRYDYKSYSAQIGGRSIGQGVERSYRADGDMELSYAVDAPSGTVSFTNYRGLKTDYTFALGADRKTRLTSVAGEATTNCLPSNSTFTYGANGLQSAAVGRNGAVTETNADASGRSLSVTEASGTPLARTKTYGWQGTTRYLSSLEDGHVRTEFTYDTAMRVTQVKQTDILPSSPSLGAIRLWSYQYTTVNGLSQVSSIDGPGLAGDGVLDITQFAYTPSGRLESVTDAQGNLTQILEWNAVGLPTQVQMPDLTRWHLSYDALGRLTSFGKSHGLGSPVLSTLSYNKAGKISSYVDMRGGSWLFSYSPSDLLVRVAGPQGQIIEYDHDDAGAVVQERLVGLGGTAYVENTLYDELGRMRQTLGAMGQQTTFAYDVEDNLISTLDPAGQTSSQAYDALNRITSTIDQGGYTTTMAHNPADGLTSFTDPRSIATTFAYNGFGEVVAETSADRGNRSFTYNSRGLVASYTDPRGIVTHYAYDHAGRLATVDYPAGTLPDIQFGYDQEALTGPANSNRGKLSSVTGGAVSSQYRFTQTIDGTSLQTQSTYPMTRSYGLTEAYDHEGNLISLAYPSGAVVEFTRDDAGQVTQIRRNVGGSWSVIADQMTYRPFGPLASMRYGDGFTQNRSYDQSYRLTGLQDSNAALTLRNMTYGHDLRDNITTITDLQDPARSEAYGYSLREQLVSATGAYGTQAFDYDGVGNRISKQLGSSTDTYSYPLTSNRLQQISLGAGGSRSFVYDAAGNVTQDNRSGGGFAYNYDAAGRMSEVRVGGVLQASYLYDVEGRQVVRSLASGQVIHSVFDSMGRRIAEYSETPGALLREYIWLDWEPVAVIEGGTVHFLRADHIGRPIFATNTTGTVVWTASYDPFGNVQTSTGTPATIRFPGQWFQSETGLHQNWMRDYDPTTGRYMQADPLGLIDGASVYGYVGGNPGRWIDPRGEFGVLGALAGAGGNLAIQFVVNYVIYGDIKTALRCVDIKAVLIGGFYGSIGVSVLKPVSSAVRLGVRRKFQEAGRDARKAAGTWAVVKYTNIVTGPPIRFGDKCECSKPSVIKGALSKVLNVMN